MGTGGGLGGLPAYAGGLDPRLCELPQPITYEQEKREHEQAITLAALTRSVLALARSAAAAAASASGGANGGDASAPVAMKQSVAAGAVLGKVAPPAVATTPASIGVADRAVGAATRAAEDGQEGAGVGGPADESDPEGREKLAATVAAAAADEAEDEAETEDVPSEESLYLEAMEEHQFATMQMEVASTLTSTAAAAAGGSGELFSFRTAGRFCRWQKKWSRVTKRAGAREAPDAGRLHMLLFSIPKRGVGAGVQ